MSNPTEVAAPSHPPAPVTGRARWWVGFALIAALAVGGALDFLYAGSPKGSEPALGAAPTAAALDKFTREDDCLDHGGSWKQVPRPPHNTGTCFPFKACPDRGPSTVWRCMPP